MADLYRLTRAFLTALPAETAHGLTIRALASGLGPSAGDPDDPVLATTVAGLALANPIGLAAGFDKNGEVPDAMLRLGFGFVEVGSVTPRPQPGNPRPRVFRLRPDRAVINRLGFNNHGMEAVAARLARRGRAGPGVLGVNVGANKDAADRVRDYVTGIDRFAGLADYLTVNISSPNTPGLRALQSRAALDDLLARVIAARDGAAAGGPPTPLFLKIAPDLTDEDARDIADVALARAVDGLIVSNTTIARPDTLTSPHRGQAGGLSGRPLFKASTRVLADMYRLTDGRLPIVGVGGVSSGGDAYAKIRAGASLVQLYTALVYEGPGLVGRIKRELASLLKRDGFASVAAAVGADHRDG